jgi:demethoxyubiquinone hydroxylase (CLK1/Coq7/Cat5 family)
MSTTFWAVFLGVSLAYIVTTLIEGLVEEYHLRRHIKYLEHLEDSTDDLLEDLRSTKK